MLSNTGKFIDRNPEIVPVSDSHLCFKRSVRIYGVNNLFSILKLKKLRKK